jgi:hypothetical protein
MVVYRKSGNSLAVTVYLKQLYVLRTESPSNLCCRKQIGSQNAGIADHESDALSLRPQQKLHRRSGKGLTPIDNRRSKLRLDQINLGAAVGLPLDEFELGDLAICFLELAGKLRRLDMLSTAP